MTARRWIAVAAGGALLFTLLVSVTSGVRFAYRSPSLHVAIETAAALISLGAAHLMHGRFLRTLELRDLLLTAALAVFAASNLVFAALPAIIDADRGRFAAWAPVGGRTLGAALMAAAALAPDHALRHPARSARRLLGASLVILAAVALLAALAAEVLPRPLPPGVTPEGSDRPLVLGDPALLAASLVAVPMFATAALGLGRTAERTGDATLRWFAIAATIAAFACVNDLLFPSLYSEWLYASDVLRFAFVLSLLAGVAVEVGRTHRRLAAAAVLDERRRIARELHDGLAQDLVFIVVQGTRLAGRADAPPVLRDIGTAARRALDEARSAISTLARPVDEPLAVAVERTAREAAGREGAHVEMAPAAQVCVPQPTHEALVRVVREAVINAVRHGGARTVSVELSEGPGLRLRVADDGRGFDGARGNGGAGRFGLTTMRERVDAIGGELRIESRRGQGTEVLVVVP